MARSKAPRGRARTLADEQAALAAAIASPSADQARDAVSAALESRFALVVARAARLVGERRWDGFGAALRAGFERFIDDPVKRDPSCHAKRATIETLDLIESQDPAPFLTAARWVQLEPAWGPPIDTAAPLRQRGLLALARLGHQELELLCAERLVDLVPPVRAAAAEALAHGRAPGGPPLLLLKLRVGDEDPMVTLAVMQGLLALAPERGEAELAPLLAGDGDLRELAAIALGQSRSERALDLLAEALATAVRAVDRQPLYRAIGLHRSERALALLLERIETGAHEDAVAALEAVAPRRFDPGVSDRVRAAARANSRCRLDRELEQALGGG